MGETEPLVLGVTVEGADATATRFAGPAPETTTTPQSLLWPGVSRLQGGLSVEETVSLGETTRAVLGARLDHFSAEAARADVATMGGGGPSPLQLWTRYYGIAETSWSATG